jgi:hypothetical protein
MGNNDQRLPLWPTPHTPTSSISHGPVGESIRLGADRFRPFAGVDRAGLAWFIGKGEVVAITAETATIQKPSGARQTFYRRPRDVERR